MRGVRPKSYADQLCLNCGSDRSSGGRLACAYGVLGAWLRSCNLPSPYGDEKYATVQQARRLTQTPEQAPRLRTRSQRSRGELVEREVVAFAMYVADSRVASVLGVQSHSPKGE